MNVSVIKLSVPCEKVACRRLPKLQTLSFQLSARVLKSILELFGCSLLALIGPVTQKRSDMLSLQCMG